MQAQPSAKSSFCFGTDSTAISQSLLNPFLLAVVWQLSQVHNCAQLAEQRQGKREKRAFFIYMPFRLLCVCVVPTSLYFGENLYLKPDKTTFQRNLRTSSIIKRHKNKDFFIVQLLRVIVFKISMECPHLDSQVNTCVFVCTFFVLC